MDAREQEEINGWDRFAWITAGAAGLYSILLAVQWEPAWRHVLPAAFVLLASVFLWLWHSLSRLARNTQELRRIAEQLQTRGRTGAEPGE